MSDEQQQKSDLFTYPTEEHFVTSGRTLLEMLLGKTTPNLKDAIHHGYVIEGYLLRITLGQPKDMRIFGLIGNIKEAMLKRVMAWLLDWLSANGSQLLEDLIERLKGNLATLAAAEPGDTVSLAVDDRSDAETVLALESCVQ